MRYDIKFDGVGLIWEPNPAKEADYAIWKGDMKLFLNCLNVLTDDQIASEIETWIETAIEAKHPEFTIFLLDYKDKHNLYNPPNWDI